MKKEYIILSAIFVLVLASRLLIAFSIPNLTYDSYFHIKQISQITEKGKPIYNDPLSYGGRNLVFLPFFHYLVSLFDLALPLELAAKIIPNLLIASLVILVYLLAKKISNDEKASLISAFIAGFIPVLWQTNLVSPIFLFLPLMLLAIYSFINLQKKVFIYLYLTTMLFLSLTTPTTFLLIIGLILYLFLSKIEEKRIDKAELELTLFSLFFFLWIQFLFFKETFLTEGWGFIWQNIPPQIVYQYFPKVSIVESLILIGAVPFFIGIYIIYKSFFEEKNKNVFLLFSLAISTAILTWFNLVEYRTALMLFGLILAILFSQFYKSLTTYFKQTKISKFKIVMVVIMFLLAIFTSVYPSLSLTAEQQTPSPEEIKAFLWLKENTPEGGVVLATLKEGQLLNYLSKRKNVMDDQFSLIKGAEERFNDLNSLFVTKYQTQAIDLLNKHKIDYIFFSPQAKKIYKIEQLAYLDKKCFELIYSNVVQIYRSKCKIQMA